MEVVVFILILILVLSVLSHVGEKLKILPFWMILVISMFLFFSPYLAYKGTQLFKAYTYVSSLTTPYDLYLLWPTSSNIDTGIFGGCATIAFRLSDQSIENLNNNKPMNNKPTSIKIKWHKTSINYEEFGSGWYACSLSRSDYNEIIAAGSKDKNGIVGYSDHGQIVALPSIGILVYSEQSGR